MSLELDRALERGDYPSIPDATDFIDKLLSKMLGQAVRRFQELEAIPDEAIPVLVAAKNARNYFAHEGAQMGLAASPPTAEESSIFREHAIALARGDNLVSWWSYQLEDDENIDEPELSKTYVLGIVDWILEPLKFDGSSPG